MISIVIPLYNEAENVEELAARTLRSIAAIDEAFEIICVDDGSEDDTLARLLEVREEDRRIKVLGLTRNFGHQRAIRAGLEAARGDVIGVMDGDLQDPPELFPRFHKALEEGHDVVYGVRRRRKEGALRRLAYWSYYRLLSALSEEPIPLDSGDFSLVTREVLDDMLRFSEHGVYLRGIRSWVGYRQAAVEYERPARAQGRTKYGWPELRRLALDGLFGFSHVPIKALGRVGALIVALCAVYAVWAVFERLFLETSPAGFTTLIVAILFLAGIQLLSLRVLGEYIVRIYDESRNRPHYLVRKRYFG